MSKYAVYELITSACICCEYIICTFLISIIRTDINLLNETYVEKLKKLYTFSNFSCTAAKEKVASLQR